MTLEDGVEDLEKSVILIKEVQKIPETMEEAEEGRYLWVIGTADCPCGLEKGEFGQARLIGSIKHTNLTGGAEGHCGGELWFLTDRRIMMNGDSGRYGPVSEDQLRDAALCFIGLGYSVGYIKFNERNRPKSIAVGDEDYVWL